MSDEKPKKRKLSKTKTAKALRRARGRYKKNTKDAFLNIRINTDVRESWRAQSIMEECTLSDFVNRVIDDYLKDFHETDNLDHIRRFNLAFLKGGPRKQVKTQPEVQQEIKPEVQLKVKPEVQPEIPPEEPKKEEIVKTSGTERTKKLWFEGMIADPELSKALADKTKIDEYLRNLNKKIREEEDPEADRDIEETDYFLKRKRNVKPDAFDLDPCDEDELLDLTNTGSFISHKHGY